jgi:ribosomal protein L37AE/L43A
MSKVIRIDDECFKALQAKAAALNEPFKPVGEILRVCLGLDADPGATISPLGHVPNIEDEVSPESACPKCSETRTDNLINHDGHIRCTSCGCEYDLEPERPDNHGTLAVLDDKQASCPICDGPLTDRPDKGGIFQCKCCGADVAFNEPGGERTEPGVYDGNNKWLADIAAYKIVWLRTRAALT